MQEEDKVDILKKNSLSLFSQDDIVGSIENDFFGSVYFVGADKLAGATKESIHCLSSYGLGVLDQDSPLRQNLWERWRLGTYP